MNTEVFIGKIVREFEWVGIVLSQEESRHPSYPYDNEESGCFINILWLRRDSHDSIVSRLDKNRFVSYTQFRKGRSVMNGMLL